MLLDELLLILDVLDDGLLPFLLRGQLGGLDLGLLDWFLLQELLLRLRFEGGREVLSEHPPSGSRILAFSRMYL